MYYLWLLGGGTRLEDGKWEGKDKECSGWAHRAKGLEGVGNILVKCYRRRNGRALIEIHCKLGGFFLFKWFMINFILLFKFIIYYKL